RDNNQTSHHNQNDTAETQGYPLANSHATPIHYHASYRNSSCSWLPVARARQTLTLSVVVVVEKQVFLSCRYEEPCRTTGCPAQQLSSETGATTLNNSKLHT
ncbi:MAG: hypothetical protein ACYDHV_12200, partial [Desulfurivibrionaceae bacterium]